MWVLGAVGKGWAEAEAQKRKDASGIAAEFAEQLRLNPDWTVEDMKLARDAITNGRSSLLALLPDDDRLSEIAQKNLQEANWKRTGEVLDRRKTVQSELDRRYKDYMETSSTGNAQEDYDAILQIRNDFIEGTGMDAADAAFKGLRTLGSPATGNTGSLYRYVDQSGKSIFSGRRATARQEWKNILTGLTDSTGAIDLTRWEDAKQQFKSTWGDRLGGNSVWNTMFRTKDQLTQINEDIARQRLSDQQLAAFNATNRAQQIASKEKSAWIANLKLYRDQAEAAKQTAKDMGYEGEAATELVDRLSKENIKPILSEMASEAITSKWPTLNSMLDASQGKVNASDLAKVLGFENDDLAQMVGKLAKERYDKEQSESISSANVALETLIKDPNEWAAFASPYSTEEEKLTRFRALAQMAGVRDSEQLSADDMWSRVNAIGKGVFAKNQAEYKGNLYSQYQTSLDDEKKYLNSDEYANQVNAIASLAGTKGDQRFADDEAYQAAVIGAVQQLFNAGGVYYFDLSGGTNHYIQALMDYAADNKEELTDGKPVNTFAIATRLQQRAGAIFKAAQNEMLAATNTAPQLPRTQSEFMSSEAQRKAAYLVGPQYIDADTYNDEITQGIKEAENFVNSVINAQKELTKLGGDLTPQEYDARIKSIANQAVEMKKALSQAEAEIQTYISMPGRFGGNIQDNNIETLKGYLQTIKDIQANLGAINFPDPPSDERPGSNEDTVLKNTGTRSYRHANIPPAKDTAQRKLEKQIAEIQSELNELQQPIDTPRGPSSPRRFDKRIETFREGRIAELEKQLLEHQARLQELLESE